MKSCFAAALGIMLSAAVTFAQSSSVTVDVTSARMRYADTVSATAFSLAPQLMARSSHAALSATGMLSRLGNATTGSGTIDGSLFPSGQRRVHWEIELMAGGSHHSDGTRTGEFLGSARIHFASTRRGAWLGAGAGRTWDGTWRRILQGDAGGWVSTGGDVFALLVSPTSVDDTIRYLDGILSYDRQAGRLELGASVGARAGDRIPTLPANRTVWGGVTAALWVTRGSAVVASVGTYPVDFTQGYPGGRYVSVGLRFAPRRALPLPAPRQPVTGVVRRFEIRALGDSVEFRVLAPSAAKVDVAGDFTGWEPVALSSGGNGWWTSVARVTSGTHQMNVRVDGGAWLVPPGLTPITDEFGVVSGLLVIQK